MLLDQLLDALGQCSVDPRWHRSQYRARPQPGARKPWSYPDLMDSLGLGAFDNPVWLTLIFRFGPPSIRF
jgi:hypothetical protein